MDLTQQEVLAVIGQKELEILMLRKQVAALETQLKAKDVSPPPA